MVTEYLVKGCGWTREHRQIVCTCAAHMTGQGWDILSSHKGHPLKAVVIMFCLSSSSWGIWAWLRAELLCWTSGGQTCSCLQSYWMGVCNIGAEQRWQLFNDTFLRAQEFSAPQHKKSCRGGRKLVWLSKDLLVNLREKNEMYRQ